MNLARTIVLIVSLGAGLVAAYLAFVLVRPSGGGPITQRTPTVEVIVAIRNVQGGGIFQETDVRWVEWPENGVTPGMITRAAEPAGIKSLAGKVALQGISPGEPIRKDKILDTGGGGTIAAVIPAGKRAYAITIDEKNTAGGFILPNDRVDILTVRSMTPTGPGSKAIIRGAKVLAIGHRIDPTGEKVALARYATVEVTPEQLELLASLERDVALLLAPLSLLDAQAAESATDDKVITPTITSIGKSL